MLINRGHLAGTAVTVLALGTVVLLVAACGAASGPGVASLGSTTTTSPEASTNTNVVAGSNGAAPGGATIEIGGTTVQYSQCMRSHGVPNFPDPNGQGGVVMRGIDPNSPQFAAAQKACAKYGGPGGNKHPSAAQQQEMIAQALKFSQCMRSHGLTDFPDPSVGPNGGVGISIRAGKTRTGQSSNLNPNNPLFQTAQKACQGIMGKAAQPVQAP